MVVNKIWLSDYTKREAICPALIKYKIKIRQKRDTHTWYPRTHFKKDGLYEKYIANNFLRVLAIPKIIKSGNRLF